MDLYNRSQLKYRTISAIVGIIILLMLLMVVSITKAHEISDTELACQNIKGPWVQLDENVIENGMIEETYGRGADAPIAMITLSIPLPIDRSIDGNSHEGHPLYYILDLDSDGVLDDILINREQDGDCQKLENITPEFGVGEEI